MVCEEDDRHNSCHTLQDFKESCADSWTEFALKESRLHETMASASFRKLSSLCRSAIRVKNSRISFTESVAVLSEIAEPPIGSVAVNIFRVEVDRVAAISRFTGGRAEPPECDTLDTSSSACAMASEIDDNSLLSVHVKCCPSIMHPLTCRLPFRPVCRPLVSTVTPSINAMGAVALLVVASMIMSITLGNALHTLKYRSPVHRRLPVLSPTPESTALQTSVSTRVYLICADLLLCVMLEALLLLLTLQLFVNCIIVNHNRYVGTAGKKRATTIFILLFTASTGSCAPTLEGIMSIRSLELQKLAWIRSTQVTQVQKIFMQDSQPLRNYSLRSLQQARSMSIRNFRTPRSIALRGSKQPDGSFVAKLHGSPNTGYCVTMQIGSPGNQEFCVLVDTGSANLAIAGADDSHINERFRSELSSTYQDLDKTAKVSYTSGEWEGKLSREVISIDDSLQVTAYLVLIMKAKDFYIKEAQWVGILGMGYSKLAKPGDWVETFWDTYRTARNLPNVFSLQLCPPLDVPILPQESSTVPQDGWMVLGGINKTYYHRQPGIFYTPIVKEEFYNVLITNLTVGSRIIELHCKEFNDDQTIVDSGTTDIFLPGPVFKEVINTFSEHFADGIPLLVPEGFWTGGKKLAWPVDDLATIYGAFPTFNIGFATHDNESMEFMLAVTPQMYLRQVKGSNEEQLETNCYPDCDFFTFGIRQREKGTVLGGNMMLGYYTVFDQGEKRVGFGESTCKYQDNSKDNLPKLTGPYPREPVNCACHNCGSDIEEWEIITYVCGGIVIPFALLSICMAVGSRIGCDWCSLNKCKRYPVSKPESSGALLEEGDTTPLVPKAPESSNSSTENLCEDEVDIHDSMSLSTEETTVSSTSDETENINRPTVGIAASARLEPDRLFPSDSTVVFQPPPVQSVLPTLTESRCLEEGASDVITAKIGRKPSEKFVDFAKPLLCRQDSAFHDPDDLKGSIEPTHNVMFLKVPRSSPLNPKKYEASLLRQASGQSDDGYESLCFSKQMSVNSSVGSERDDEEL